MPARIPMFISNSAAVRIQQYGNAKPANPASHPFFSQSRQQSLNTFSGTMINRMAGAVPCGSCGGTR